MVQRGIKAITIEYESGEITSVKEEGIRHIERRSYPKGATKVEHGYVTHEIRWDEKPERVVGEQ
jgi:hypothetical protein